MKKPYNEEKTGLRIELKITSIFFIALIISKEIFSQIPINGFCQYKSYKVDSGFKSLFALNFNNDFYTDLVLFNPDSKKIEAIAGEKNGGYSKPISYSVPYEITNIHNLIERNKIIKKYAFVSRQKMRAGIYAFTSSGRPYLSSSIKFKSYPGNISTADINKNGKDEFLISGSAFDGLSLVYQTSSGLKEKKIISNISFSNAIFTDLSNDNYPDIAAFNVLNNSLIFFYNDGTGQFRKVRSIKFDQPIHLLYSTDLNLDSYNDLIFSEGKSIKIIYGDSASSYSITNKINTKYKPDQIITGDFNRDGKMDIAYSNSESGTLSIFFGKDTYSFYPEIIYSKKDGIQNIIPYYSKFLNGIAAINFNGYVFTVTNLPPFLDNANISLGGQPSALSFFDDGNNGIFDICYIDNFTHSLDLIVRNISGIPNTFYSYPVNENHSQIIVDNTLPRIKTFFCYSYGKRLIDILKVDFAQNKIERNAVYAPGAIEDLKIKHSNNNFSNIYLTYSDGKNVGLCLMEYRDYKYSVSNYPVNTVAYCSNILKSNEIGMTYWSKENNYEKLTKIILSGGTTSSNLIYNSKIDSVNSIFSFTGDLFNNDNDATISLLQTNNNKYLTITNDKKTFIIKHAEIPNYLTFTNPNQLFFGEIRPNGLKKLYVYFPNKKFISTIDFINKGRDIIIPKLINVEDIDSFFIKKMSSRNYHLVYTNKSNGCITIKQL